MRNWCLSYIGEINPQCHKHNGEMMVEDLDRKVRVVKIRTAGMIIVGIGLIMLTIGLLVSG